MNTTRRVLSTEIRPAGDQRHFVVYTESPEVERGLGRLDHCVSLGTYYNPRGSKFAQDLMFENGQKAPVEKLLREIGNSVRPRRVRNQQI
jgi:hypothetical protein